MSQLVNDNSLFASGRNSSNTLAVTEDFLGGPTAIASGDQVGSFLRATTIGAGSSVAAVAGEAGHPGIVACTIVANEDALLQSASSLVPGADVISLEASVRVTAAAVADTAALGIGLGFDLPAAITARAQIVWQQSTNSWLCEAADGASVTTVAVPATLNTWYGLKIVLSNTQCDFYIDGAQVASITATLPATAVAPSAGALGTGGTGTGSIQIDYVSVSQSGLSR